MRSSRIGCPAVLVAHNTLYTNQQARTTQVVLGLSGGGLDSFSHRNRFGDILYFLWPLRAANTFREICVRLMTWFYENRTRNLHKFFWCVCPELQHINYYPREENPLSSRRETIILAKRNHYPREDSEEWSHETGNTHYKTALKICLNDLCFSRLSSRKCLIFTQISQISRIARRFARACRLCRVFAAGWRTRALASVLCEIAFGPYGRRTLFQDDKILWVNCYIIS